GRVGGGMLRRERPRERPGRRHGTDANWRAGLDPGNGVSLEIAVLPADEHRGSFAEIGRMGHARLRPTGNPYRGEAAGRNPIPLRGILGEVLKQLLYGHAVDGDQLVADDERIGRYRQDSTVQRVDQ